MRSSIVALFGAALATFVACGGGTEQPVDLRGDGGLGSSGGGDGGDAGALGPCPDPLTSYTPPSKPPAAAAPGKCSDAAIAAIAAACFGPKKTGKGCDDAKAAEASCSACVFSDAGAASWGPVVKLTSYGGALALNWPGCIGLLEGRAGAGTCAGPANDYALCPEARCASCSAASRAACVSSAFADGSACKNYEKPLTSCLAGSSLPQPDLEGKCGLVTPSLGAEDWVKRLAKTFCG